MNVAPDMDSVKATALVLNITSLIAHKPDSKCAQEKRRWRHGFDTSDSIAYLAEQWDRPRCQVRPCNRCFAEGPAPVGKKPNLRAGIHTCVVKRDDEPCSSAAPYVLKSSERTRMCLSCALHVQSLGYELRYVGIWKDWKPVEAISQ